jgi:hypothetical protein
VPGRELLVFAGKQVGHDLLEWLLDQGYPVARVIAATADDECLPLAAARGVPAEAYAGGLPGRLLDEGKRFGWLLNLWSPHKLAPATLTLAAHRLNVHPGRVPQCRGNDNAAWTIRLGQPAGVSLLEMTDAFDAGAVWAQREVDWPLGTRGRELHERLLAAAVALFMDAWPDLYAGRVTAQEQRGAVGSHTRKQTNADRCRAGGDSMRLEEMVRWALAHDFSPGTTAELTLDGRRYRLRLSLEPLP